MAGKKPKPTAVKKLEGNPGVRYKDSKYPLEKRTASCIFMSKNIRRG